MLEVHSPAFVAGDALPLRVATGSVGGSDISPPLSWSSVPERTLSLAVTCVDHHPVAREYLHWIVVDLPPDLPFLSEGASRSRMVPPGARELLGTNGQPGYQGAGPPPGSGPHPYEFTVWALDVAPLAVDDSAGLAGFMAAISGHVIASGSITALFER
jgi:Raf kinase inhibitor-like YbhB/YbcL family protein